MKWWITSFGGLILLFTNIALGIYCCSLTKVDLNNQNRAFIIGHIKIKDHVPLIPEIQIKERYIFPCFLQGLKMVSVINALKLSWADFNLTDLDLELTFRENFTLVLLPWSKTIAKITRNNVTLDLLLQIGLNINDSQKTLECLHNINLPVEETLEQLKAILLTSKRKFLTVLEKFVLF